MKKIRLTALFGAALLAVLSFSGCTTGNPDLDVALKPSFIVGGFTAGESASGYTDVGTNRFLPLSYTGGVAAYTWTYKAANEAWGNAAGTETFKVTLGAGWSVQWGSATLTLNGDYQELTEGSNPDNITVSGLVDGNSYTLYVKATGATVSAKIEGTAAASYYVVMGDSLNEMTVAGTTLHTYTFTTGSSAATATFTVFDSSSTWSTGGTLTVGGAAAAMTKGTTTGMTAAVTASTKYEITVDTTAAPAPTVKIEKVILAPAYMQGSFTSGAQTLTYSDPAGGARTASYTFTFSAADNANWGQTDTATMISFGVIADTGWAVKYTGVTAAVGDDYAACTQGAGNNNVISGLTNGKSYTLYVKGTADTVSVKLVQNN